MNKKHLVCFILTLTLLIGGLNCSASASYIEAQKVLSVTDKTLATRATGTFNATLLAGEKAVGSSSFPMEEGETVRINASYSPDVSMDFGLVDENGIFYYFNVTNGSIDKTIRIEESGNYTLQIRNNSSSTVKVSGFVKY